MRLVLDLQSLQSSADAHTAPHLPLTLALARAAREAGHQVLAALHDRRPASVETIRALFADAVAPADFLVFVLPAAADVSERLCEQLREGALAMACPDAVFLPAFDDTQAALSIGPQSASHATVAALDDAAAFAAAGPVRRRLACTRAALLLAADDAGAQALRTALDLPAARVAVADGDAATRARQILRLLESAAKTPPPRRPRLAFVSPLPPQQSGIADYSAELLPELARYYDVDVIADQPAIADAWINEVLDVRSSAWFDRNAHRYERIVYHFGNSPLHKHMFGLLARHPGVVVLHDFYLGNMLDHLQETGYAPGIHLDALAASHGYPALIDLAREGRTGVVWKYPCNLPVLRQASGVIVHSRKPATMADDWYGAGASRDWRVIPLLRGGAVGERAKARAALGLAEGELLVCSFGMLGPTKLNDRLLDAWLASPLAGDPRCRLVFVGENDGGQYGKALSAKIAAAGGRVTITGFASPETYKTYLAAADGAVQLRGNTRGETSAAILDCLLAGIPTIVNAHGAQAELPDEVVVKLADDAGVPALAQALQDLRADRAGMRALSSRAAQYVKDHHAPRAVGLQYVDAIEHFARANPHARRQAAIEAAAACAAPGQLTAAALAIAANEPAVAPRRWFLDISAVVHKDLKTGIQRVVRSVVLALFRDPPPGVRIEPVYCGGGGGPYRHARKFMLDMTGCGHLPLPPGWEDDSVIDPRPGDVFVGLDLLLHGTQQNAALLADMRQRGVQVHFVVYDILPLLRPDVFPPGTQEDFAGWLDTVARVSDGLVCISRAVADEVHGWLRERGWSRPAPLGIGWFHLGADLGASVPTRGMPDDAMRIIEQVRARPTLLSVGTVEPRKGHLQSLNAFELLWQRGVDVNFVVVGKQGWMVEEVADRMRAHPEAGRRLFWLEGSSDEMLQSLYEASAGLLAASEGEGFGLPLIEAAQHGLPVVARGLPVFREVLGEHGYYFDGLAPADLADALAAWTALLKTSGVPQTTGLRWLCWAESAAQLRDALVAQDWYRTLPAAAAPAPAAEAAAA